MSLTESPELPQPPWKVWWRPSHCRTVDTGDTHTLLIFGSGGSRALVSSLCYVCRLCLSLQGTTCVHTQALRADAARHAVALVSCCQLLVTSAAGMACVVLATHVSNLMRRSIALIIRGGCALRPAHNDSTDKTCKAAVGCPTTCNLHMHCCGSHGLQMVAATLSRANSHARVQDDDTVILFTVPVTCCNETKQQWQQGKARTQTHP